VAVEDIDETEPAEPAWIVIDSDELIVLLRRCYDGEDPDFVMLEMYASAETHEYEDDDGDIF
jgi:hypothetical protein